MTTSSRYTKARKRAKILLGTSEFQTPFPTLYINVLLVRHVHMKSLAPGRQIKIPVRSEQLEARRSPYRPATMSISDQSLQLISQALVKTTTEKGYNASALRSFTLLAASSIIQAYLHLAVQHTCLHSGARCHDCSVPERVDGLRFQEHDKRAPNAWSACLRNVVHRSDHRASYLPSTSDK